MSGSGIDQPGPDPENTANSSMLQKINDVRLKINDVRLTNLELHDKIEDLAARVLVVEAHNVALMQLIEMLAARLGELVPELPASDDANVADQNTDPNDESGAYL